MSSQEHEFLEMYLETLLELLTKGKDPVRVKGEVILSFDQNYSAFIPLTKGFNKKENRVYLQDCPFSKKLGIDLQRERISRQEIDGGRIFINKKGSFLKLSNKKFLRFSDISVKFPKSR